MSERASPEPSPEALEARCREAGIKLVRFLYCDNGGVIRGKVVPSQRLASWARSGVGMTVAMGAMNSLDQLQTVPGMGPVGEVRLVPDLSSFTIVPYAPATAVVLCDHVDLDGGPYPACPRQFLARMAERLAERDMELSCSVETEFSLATDLGGRYLPLDESLCFSTAGMTASAGVVEALVDALGFQNIELWQYCPELGHGQHELSVAPAGLLRAADVQVLVRETLRGVPPRFGLTASLAPKPWPDQAGNGAHVHLSLWDRAGRNLFFDPAGRFGLSRIAEHFIAGVLAHLPGLLGLTAPSFNSYQRLLPQHWSSAFICWGPDNREATVRVPSTFKGAEEASTNLEYKPADASANPYLAFGGLVAAGLDGMDRQLEAPEPLVTDPATLTEEERLAKGAHRYPLTQAAALDALASDEVLCRALGAALASSYLAVRRSEWLVHSQASDPEAPFRAHFRLY